MGRGARRERTGRNVVSALLAIRHNTIANASIVVMEHERRCRCICTCDHIIGAGVEHVVVAHAVSGYPEVLCAECATDQGYAMEVQEKQP